MHSINRQSCHRLQLPKVVLSILFALCTTSYHGLSWAGLFGPSNYEECVLDKMKGQDRSLKYLAEDACEKKFPYPREFHGYQDQLEMDWWSDASNLYVQIKKNKGNYDVKRMSLQFNSMTCDGKDAGTGNNFSTYMEISKDGSGSVRANNASQYRCMRFNGPMTLIMKK